MSKTETNGHKLSAVELAALCRAGDHRGTVVDRTGRKSCTLCGIELCASCGSACLSHTKHGTRCNRCTHVTITDAPRMTGHAPIHAAKPSASDNIMRAQEFPSTAFTDGRIS